MKKPWSLMLQALAVAAVSVFLVWFLLLTFVMRSLPSIIEAAMLVSLAIIAIALCVAFVMAWRPGRGRSYVAALTIMLVAGIAPFVIDVARVTIEAADQRIEDAKKAAEQQVFEAKLLSQIETYQKDVTERIAAKNPYTPLQAQEFLRFVQSSDLRYRSLPDYSAQTFSLLKQGLDGKILDPNVHVKGSRAIDVEEPLFVGYYKFYLQSGATMPVKRVREREWTLFQMLIAGGANLDDPAAAVLRDNVHRETAPYDPNVPGYIRLK